MGIEAVVAEKDEAVGTEEGFGLLGQQLEGRRAGRRGGHRPGRRHPAAGPERLRGAGVAARAHDLAFENRWKAGDSHHLLPSILFLGFLQVVYCNFRVHFAQVIRHILAS